MDVHEADDEASREKSARNRGPGWSRRVVSCVILGVAAIVVVLAVASTVRKERPVPPREVVWTEQERQEARDRFLSFAKRGFSKAEAREATEAFGRCLRKGDEAEKYSEVLATGRKGRSGELTTYEWYLELPFDPRRPDSMSRVLTVFVKGDPPRIDTFYYSDSMD